MTDYKIGDIVQVEEWPNGSRAPSIWSKPYEIYKINSPDDKNVIGYCSQTSYWMRSLCGEWERTWYALNCMRLTNESQ